jgi:hypothetical protein
MTDQPTDEEHRRRDLDTIFGDVLPETTSDEREQPTPEEDNDDWYLRNRPPHHEG